MFCEAKCDPFSRNRWQQRGMRGVRKGDVLITTDFSDDRCNPDPSWCMEEQQHPCGGDWSSALQSRV